MQCIVSCLVGFTLLIAMLWTMLNKNVTRNFERSLDRRQRKKYQKLAGQRFRNTITGFIIGIIIALAYYYFYARQQTGQEDPATTSGSTTSVHSCTMTAIVLVVMLCWYMFTAPTESMLSYLNQDQTYLWMEVHSKMMRNFFVGMLIGGIGFFFLTKGGQELIRC